MIRFGWSKIFSVLSAGLYFEGSLYFFGVDEDCIGHHAKLLEFFALKLIKICHIWHKLQIFVANFRFLRDSLKIRRGTVYQIFGLPHSRPCFDPSPQWLQLPFGPRQWIQTGTKGRG